MEIHNNNESAGDADGYADTLTDDSYASRSGSDSDESNTSVLERNSILSDKFMLPKDLCENDAIFQEFFSPTLWESLAPVARQHLMKFLPIPPDERPLASKIVQDLFSHRLGRFRTDQIATFQRHLAEGNFRTDIAKLRCNLRKSLRKERRMLELQRMARLAKHVVLSRETTLLDEMNGGSAIQPVFSPRYAPSGYRNRWYRQLRNTPELEKCRMNAKKRYLTEIFTVCEAAGISLSVSDEEDCLDAIPSGPQRKRRMFGAGPYVSGEQSLLPQRHGPLYGGTSGPAGCAGKRGILHGSPGAIGTNVLDGTIFGTPKLFVVTEDHYQRLLVQYRKRKFEEPEHPELDLDGVKLKDVVSRTQVAAGYRRILPLPKVYLPEPKIESTPEGSDKNKCIKSIKKNRISCDQEDVKEDVHPDTGLAKTTEAVKVEPSDYERTSASHAELMSSTTFGQADAQAESMSLPSSVCKQEEKNITLTTANAKQELVSASFMDQSDRKITPSGTKKVTPTLGNFIDEGPEELTLGSPLGADTHACFLSLVRDLFCSNPDHRSTMEELQSKLESWSRSAVAARNSWYHEYQSNDEWNMTLQSAVQFLTGDFQHQPEDFVPYIEHKVALNILQWIGASRDGDCRLVPLCAYWQSRKQEIGLLSSRTLSQTANCPGASVALRCATAGSIAGGTSTAYPAKMKNKTNVTSKLLLLSSNCSSSSSSSLSSVSSMTTIGDGSSILAEVPATSMSLGTVCSSQDDDGSVSERSVSPPPPRFPTDWAVRKATDEEVHSFQEQEKRRYENPHMAFTYKQHAYDSVVGPVKGIYTQVPGISKARGHSMLIADRPNFVTILTLVRDATARLPNGEGTRADICELLKSSQYISPTATDQILQTIVSGALDRMHTEHDPCVKYDAKRKIWIYLHRSRTEEEFERLHLQYQGFTKHKKMIAKKPVRCHKEAATPSPTAGSKEHAIATDNCVYANISHEQDGSDVSNSASNIVELPSAIGSPATNGVSAVCSPVTAYSIKTANASLLKKHPPTSVLSNSSRKADESISSGGTGTTTIARQPEQTKPSVLTLQPQQSLQSTASDTAVESPVKIAPSATNSAVTLITSTGSTVKTIKIPKSSLSLASKSVGVFASDSGAGQSTSVKVDGSTTVENLVPSYITLPQKNVLVSAFVSTGKSTPVESGTTASTIGCSSTLLPTDVLRKIPSMPIIVQSSPSQAVPSRSPTTPASCSVDGDKKVAPSSSVLSIRQLSSGAGTVVASTASGVVTTNHEQTAPPASTHILLQTKTVQLPINSAAMASTSATGNVMHTGVKVHASTMVGAVPAGSAKPIFTTSTGSSHVIKSLPASATILSHSAPAPSSTVPQRVVVSSGSAYTPGPGGSVSTPGVTVTPTGIITSTGGGMASSATLVPNSTGQRVLRPSANLISTITLAKGQQSVLTSAQQKQILQNLFCQQQKQQMLTAKKVVPSTLAASIVSSTDHAASGDSRTGDQTSTASLLQDNQRAGAGVGTVFKLQHASNAAHSIKALSPQIVKMTPGRVCGPSAGSISLPTNAVVTGPSATMGSLAVQMPAGVKVMKMPQSSILTSSGGHTMSPAGANTTCSGMVTVSAASAATATMRVLKTATGTTTVIKTGGVQGGMPSSAQLLPQTPTVHHGTVAKLRKDGSSPIVSKVTVSPNVSSSSGQLIPLESLLQKQGITTTATKASPGGMAVGSTFLKIAGTGKPGQPQFLQFSTNSPGSQATANVSPITSVGGGAGQQYTVVAQNARNIISVTPSTGGTTNRSATNLPVTIVTSLAPEAATEASKSTSYVSSSVGTGSTVSATSGTTIVPHTAIAAKLQQANKIKLFAPAGGVNAAATPTGTSGQHGEHTTVMRPKTPMTATVLGGSAAGGEFLANAKIIGVRNVTAGKMKAGSSLSIMNSANLNIAHIGGKPIIIANSTALTGNPAVTGTIGSGTMQGNNSVSSGGTVMFTSNANYTKNVLTASTPTVGDGAAGSGGGSVNVSGPSGHKQMQTLMLGNQMVKVQTIQAAAAGKLVQQKRHTVLSSMSGTPRDNSTTAAGTVLTTAGGCTVVQQQPQQHAALCSSGITVAGGSSVPKGITVSSGVGVGALSKSIVKIQPGGTAPNSTAAKILDMGQAKAQAQQPQRVVLATSSGQLLTQPIILPSGFQSSGPINIKRLKVIPVSKQSKK